MEYPFKSLMPLDEVTARDGYYKDWTHIDADTFHQISELVKFVREKGYGADTREAFAQALERVYYDATQTGNANLEVSMARRGYNTLAESLGNLSVNMINKNLGKLDQTFLTEELIGQMTGNTPVNAIPADDSLTTAKYVDGSVTGEKLHPLYTRKGLFASGDLNNVHEPGSYQVSGDDVLNKPGNIYTGHLIVFNANGGWTTQIFNDIQPTNSFYIRSLRDNGSLIGEWQPIGVGKYMTTQDEEWGI